MVHPTFISQVHGGLAGAVTADALGSLTETLSRRQIADLYGWVDDFQPFRFKPFGQTRPVGGWTDDSSLIVYTLRAFIAQQEVSLAGVIAGLEAWTQDPEVSQFSGPTTARALERIRSGEDPRVVGLGEPGPFAGISNGSAMKAAPAGWLHPGDVTNAVRTVALICTPTHNTNVAMAGAGAIAAACAVAAGPTATLDDLVAAACAGAELGNALGLESGREVAGPALDRRIQLAVQIASAADSFENAVADLSDIIGSGLAVAEAVPAAIGLLVAAQGDPNLVAIGAANIGDDTDTVGTMATAIAGTWAGIAAINPAWLELVSRVNRLDLAELARETAQLATSPGRP